MFTLSHIHNFVELHSILAYILIVIGVIIEGEIIVLLAGVFSGLGSLNFAMVFIMATIGGILKSIIGYNIGLYLKRKHSHLMLIKQAEHKVNYFFPRFKEKPFWSVFLARVPIWGLHWFTILYSGYKEIEVRIFAKAEMLSLVLWSASMIAIGYFFSLTALSISHDVRKFVIIILACFVGFFIIEKIAAFIIELLSFKKKTD